MPPKRSSSRSTPHLHLRRITRLTQKPTPAPHSSENRPAHPNSNNASRQYHSNNQVEPDPSRHHRPLVGRTKVPEAGAEQGRNEGSGEKYQSDDGDDSHVGAVLMVDFVVLLGDEGVYLIISIDALEVGAWY